MDSKPALKGTVVVLSGGLDSTVVLADCLTRYPGWEVHALSFQYAQRHAGKELSAASRICEHFRVHHQLADLSDVAHLFAGKSALTTDTAVPDGHYADDSMKRTVVPNRNMIMLSMAIGYATHLQCKCVVYGAHAGDHAIYPDCRPAFVDAMATATQSSGWDPPALVAPFLAKSKADIVRHGHALGVPMHMTWSCYKGGDKHCGTCGTCVERKEAFAQAEVRDDTEYAA